ncbi:MAG: recombination protein RecR [Clostridia bacterium]|nr:recombination protein RecR [Clostridia bacterium]
MGNYIPPMQRMIDCFRRLPGVGSKSAVRMAFGVLSMSQEEANEFCNAIVGMKQGITHCRVCRNLSDSEICSICSDERRDASVICVVEDTRTLMAIERTNDYTGLYHVLGGAISPVNGITPDMLEIQTLISRLGDDCVKEIIIATNPNIEGETTAIYLSKLIKPLDIKVTRLAYGVSVGSDLEYTDGETLAKAISGRQEI